MTSGSGLAYVWGRQDQSTFFQTKAHRGLRDLQNLSTFCFVVYLVGLALTLACTSTLLISESRVWGLSKVTSSWTPAPWIRHLSVHLSPNIFQSSASSEPGLAVYVKYSNASDFTCLSCNTGRRCHMKSILHKADIEQWKSCRVPCLYWQRLCLVVHSGSDRFLPCDVVSYALSCRELPACPCVVSGTNLYSHPACSGLRCGL